MNKSVFILVLVYILASIPFSCGPDAKVIAEQAAKDWTEDSKPGIAKSIADSITEITTGNDIPSISKMWSSDLREIIATTEPENISWSYSEPQTASNNSLTVTASSILNIDLPFYGAYTISVDFDLTIDTRNEETTVWEIATDSLSATSNSRRVAVVEFDGWYVGDNEVTTAYDSDTATAQISMSNGEAGEYTMRLRKAGVGERVEEIVFDYDGISTVQELFFVPHKDRDWSEGGKYPDSEEYYTELVYEEKKILKLENVCPPRLTVNTGDNTYRKNQSWFFAGEQWEYTVEIPKERYDYYEYWGRKEILTYKQYVINTDHDVWIEDIVDMFVEESREKEWTDYNTIWFMQSFVQSFPYKSDDMTTRYDDYPRYPAETIVDGGDCEDSAILLAALVRKLNHGVALLLFREDAHMAVGVEVDEDFADNWSLPYELTYYTDDDGQMYAYCETTAEGWGFGEKPPDIESSPDISVVN